MMIKKILLIMMACSLTLTCVEAQTQQSKKYKGRIVDQGTNKSLENVYVILQNTSEGTITNAEGYFEISVPEDAEKDSLKISHLGYSLKKVAVRDLSQQTAQKIMLEPQPTILPEVVVSAGLTAREILEKVRQGINSNFCQKPFSSDMFYRHEMRVNDSVQYVEEAAIDFYDSEGFKRQPKGQISKGKLMQIKQLRRSMSRDKNQYISLWDLPVFWTTDPILSPDNLLTKSQDKDYELKLVGGQVFGDINVFEIKFVCNKPTVANTGYGSPSPRIYEGTLYVDVNSYAVVKYVADIKWNDRVVKDKKFLRRFEVSEESNFARSAELEFSYKKINGVYVLHYAKMRDHFNFTGTQSKNSITRSYNNELLSVRTNLEKPKVLTQTILNVDPKTFPYDAAFWETFNFISERQKSGK